MRIADRLAIAAALGLALGLAPARAFEGPVRPPADVVVTPAPVPVPLPPVSRAAQADVPRPPGSIPRAGAASAIPNAPLPRPRGPIPVVATPAPTLERPLPPPTAFAAPSVPITPFEALKSGTRALRDGHKDKGLKQLEYAADQGNVAAQWKLGRMYAEGDGVDQSDIKAFDYFSRIANRHPDDNPTGPDARYIANAFVSLGHFYRDGIANSPVRADLGRALHMYNYAASYFADPEAQYHLARILLDNGGPFKDPRQATRWLNSAAKKDQHQAQAVLGRMLFKGEYVPRQPARGLMLLAVANANAPSEAWIADLYQSAYNQASNDEKALAGDMLVRWVNGRRD